MIACWRRGIAGAFMAATMLAFANDMVRAGDVVVGVATNFLTTAEILATEFESTTDHTVTLVSGSSGKLFAQITNGAPYDVFLSADETRPDLLQTADLVEGQMTYAVGQLVLIARSDLALSLNDLADRSLRLAIASPEIAPYGLAARDVLATFRTPEDWDQGVVFGESVGQAFGFFATGNVDAAFVAAAQAKALASDADVIDIPQNMYTPIQQDAVLLKRANQNPAAVTFFDFLRGAAARMLIRDAGYWVTE